MPRSPAKLRIPAPRPAWMADWPRGLTPAQVAWSRDGVELDYALPDGRRVRVALVGSERGVRIARIHAELERGSQRDGQLLTRLQLALERRLAAAGTEAARWIARAGQLCAQIEGESSDESSTSLAARVGRWIRASARSNHHEIDPEQLRALRGQLGPGRLAGLGQLAFAASALEDALSIWSGLDDDSPKHATGFLATFERTLALAASGMEAQAGELAAELPRLAEGLDQRRMCGRILHALHLAELACEQLAAVCAQTGRWEDLRLLARAAVTAGDAQALITALERDPRLLERCSAAQQLELALALRDAGGYAKAEELLRPVRLHPELSGPANEALAHLELWRLDLDLAAVRARELIERAGPAPRPLMILGAATFLTAREAGGWDPARLDESLALLDQAYLLEPDRPSIELRVWRIEALIAAERLEEANAAVHEEGFEDAAAWQLIRAALEARFGGEGLRARTAYIHRSILREVFADEPEPLRFDDDEQTLAWIDRALRRFGGNRSPTLTFVEDGRLTPAPHVVSPRARVESIQQRILHRQPDEVREALARTARDNPDVPFGWTYASEIDLWSGRYERALESFEQIWQATKTRWGYVGSAAAAYLLGHHERALERWREGLEVYGEYLPGEATHTYMAELLRKRGELERARAMLEHTLDSTPTRLGAWINLALIELELGERSRAERALEFVNEHAQILTWAASRALGRAGSTRVEPQEAAPVLERALQMMRGNRSSGLQTFVDPQGRFRVLSQDHGRRWIELAGASWELAIAQLVGGLLDTRRGG